MVTVCQLLISKVYKQYGLFARSSHMEQNHTCYWGSCAVGLTKQCNSYQSTWTCLWFESATEQLAHQHVWFCTMWPDCAKGLLLEKLQHMHSKMFKVPLVSQGEFSSLWVPKPRNCRQYPYPLQMGLFIRFPQSLWKFQLSCIHFFKLLSLTEPLQPLEIPIPICGQSIMLCSCSPCLITEQIYKLYSVQMTLIHQ